MLKLNIPLAEDFVEIIKNNEIKNWESKCFWLIIKQSDRPRILSMKRLRERMYTAIQVLLKNDFLVAQRSLCNKRLYLYSETPKLKELRKKLIDIDENNPLFTQKNTINKELSFLKNQVDFINELAVSYPEFCDSIQKYKEEIDYQINFCEVKIKTINSIIKIYNGRL